MSSYIKNLFSKKKTIIIFITLFTLAFAIASITVSVTSTPYIETLSNCETGTFYYNAPAAKGFVYFKVKYEYYPGSCCSIHVSCWEFTIEVYDSENTVLSPDRGTDGGTFFCYTKTMRISKGGGIMGSVKIWIRFYNPNPIYVYFSIGYAIIWLILMVQLRRLRIMENKMES